VPDPAIRPTALPWLVIGAWASLACPSAPEVQRTSAPDASVQLAPPPAPEAALPRVVGVTTRSSAALEAFTRGRALSDNSRGDESVELFRKALELDPGFAFAHAYLGYESQGPDSLDHLTRAQELSKTLPEPERLFIAFLCATRQGERAKAADAIQRLIRVAPDDWRVVFELGQQSFRRRQWATAVAAFKKSMVLVHTCTAYNNIAYAQGMQGHFDLGILALQRCIEMEPKEPNPRDSLGEFQLAAGQLDAAEASFHKALELDGHFYSSWHGIAMTRYYRGDWKGGHAALEQARQAALIPGDRLELRVIAAWAYLGDANPQAAFAELTSMEHEAAALKEGPYGLAWAHITRSALHHEQGADRNALEEARTALDLVEQARLPGAVTEALRWRARLREGLALCGLGKPSEAGHAAEELERANTESPDNAELIAAAHLLRGEMAASGKRLEEAIRELSRCELTGLTDWSYDYRGKPDDVYCRWRLAQVSELAGHAEAGHAIEDELRGHYSRDPETLYVEGRLLHKK
jgi:tetratricopeptide (TPR) repeat protein